MPNTALAIHGGAGTLSPKHLTAEKRAIVTAGLQAALAAGQRVLLAGGSAVNAVTAAVSALEDDPSFNAGHGAVFTSVGTHEMDAAIMDGATQQVGAVAGLLGPRNPIQAARVVMEQSPHVLLAAAGAVNFLHAHGIPCEPPAYFGTPERRAALQAVLHDRAQGRPTDDFNRHGTVGAVARDSDGRLAAATSTGGMTGKLPGRIGDTPLAGAGTWADAVCAISATGHGESFIRIAAGHELSAQIRLASADLQTAAGRVMAALEAIGGTGGFIAIDRSGEIVMPFNTRGMYRGQAIGDAPPQTAIYGEALTS